MAIVFISPQKRQRILLFAIIGFFVLVLLVIGFSVYFTKPKVVKTEEYFTATPVRINWNILKSDNLANLVVVPEIKKQFQFSAKTTAGLEKTGIVSAKSEEEAMQALEKLNLISITLSELKAGRENPFSPYYLELQNAPS